MDRGGRKHRTLTSRAEGARDAVLAVVPRTPLLKPVRRATRQFRAVLDGRISAPKHATGYLYGTVLGGTLALSVALSGKALAWADASLAHAGLAIIDVQLSGARETTDDEIAERIGLDTIRSLPSIDIASARDALLALPWVERVELEKIYPGTLRVAISERRAAALWRVGPRTLLLDEAGHPIVPSDGRNLPLLVGEGADGVMTDGLELFEAVPAVTKQIKALVRVGDRRWNVVTHRNVTVMLPEHGPEAALATLAELHATDAILDKDLVSIDLRVGDRIALRLPEEGAASRKETLEAAAEERKKTRKSREVSL